MKSQISTFDDLIKAIIPEGSSPLIHSELVEGLHTPMFAAMLLDLLDLEQSTGGDQMSIYSAINSVIRSEMLECEIADKIKNLTAEISTNPSKRSILCRVLQKQAGTRQKLLEAGRACELPELSQFEIDEHQQYVMENLDKVFGEPAPDVLTFLANSDADGTLSTLYNSLLDLKNFDDDDQKFVPGRSDEFSAKFQGSSSEPVPFQGNDEALKDALFNIFESVGHLQGAPVDALYITERLESAVHRCIQFAYEFTGNNRSNFKGYIDALSEYSNDSNKLKNELYQSVSQICDYVNDYDHSIHKLNPTYETLRLSQIIPNYFLKTKGYVMDASSCSSGKTGTILLAPVETNSKMSVVLVENNTYETIIEEFRSWYSSRPDFVIVGKNEFWPTSIFDWTQLEENVIIVLDKAFVSRIDEGEREKANAETFLSLVSRSGIELLVADEVHNYKGQDKGEGFKAVSNGVKDSDESHTNCSRCVMQMALYSKYRLFSSATPLLNDLEEPARIMTMLFPSNYNTKDKNFRHLEALRQIKDSPDCTEGILEKTSILYTPFQSNTTRVPRPTVQYDVEVISNEGTSLLRGKVVEGNKNWMKSWTKALRKLWDEQIQKWDDENKSYYWSEQKQDEIHFDLYLTMMENQIVEALRSEKQICFYTGNSMQTHKDLQKRILKIAKKHKIALDSSEVVIANGSTSNQLRKPVDIKGYGHKRPELIKEVWNKGCKVLIANEVIDVGLDGLQGTDAIDDCGRISVVFLLANPYTDASKYQLFSRFVRTQGSDTNKLPEVKFYQPQLFWDASRDDDASYSFCRNEFTNGRLLKKKIRADLLIDGTFPEGVNIKELQEELPPLIFQQFADGSFNTEEAREEREDLATEILQKSTVVL